MKQPNTIKSHVLLNLFYLFFLKRLNLCSYKDNYVDLQNLKINRTLRGLVFFKTKTFSCTWENIFVYFGTARKLVCRKKIDNMTWICRQF